MFQEIGYNINYEPILGSGKTPDFLINTSLGEYVIECISPIFNSEVGNYYKQITPLIDIVRRYVPANWRVLIENLPDIGFNDSKKQFKSFLKNELQKLSKEDGKAGIPIGKEFPQGNLELTLFFKPERSEPILNYPPYAYMENSVSRIKHALDEKRKQLRSITQPVILAIQGSATGTDLEDFDQVLFGHSYEMMGANREVVKNGFKPDGIFISDNTKPTFQGVLAFHEVGFQQLRKPTLYLHEQATAELQEIFNAFHIRFYDRPKNQIKEIKSNRYDYFTNFHFVSV